MNERKASVTRTTSETETAVEVNLDGSGESSIGSGIGFLDHMLTALAMHSRIDLRIRCAGDLEVDDHHSVEDVALAVGEAIGRALGRRTGVSRFGSRYAPLDEALVRCVIDLSGRPGASVELPLRRERLGGLSCENVPHFFSSLAKAARMTLHLDLIRGENDHHKVEAAFKAFALALRDAIAIDHGQQGVPSTKGSLDC